MTATHPGTPQLRTARSSKLERGYPVQQHASGRRCVVPGCETVLSRYNPSDTCARHEGWADDS